MTDSTPRGPLTGRRILVVEDEMLVAMLVIDILADLGCEVIGPVATVAGALELMEAEAFDAAVLDVNLGSEMVYPVADTLDRSQIPFVFLTGYGPGGLDERYRGRPTIQKPFLPDQFGVELAEGLFRSGP